MDFFAFATMNARLEFESPASPDFVSCPRCQAKAKVVELLAYLRLTGDSSEWRLSQCDECGEDL